MPPLDDPRYEALAQGLARGLSLRQANAEAGLKEARPCRMRRRAARKDVAARIAELKAQMTWGDAEPLRVIYERAMALADRAGGLDSGAALAAARGLFAEAARAVREAGIFGAESGRAQTPRGPVPPDMTNEEWLAAFAPPPPPDA